MRPWPAAVSIKLAKMQSALSVSELSPAEFTSRLDQMVALYRNDGAGHFTDVTAQSGLTRRGWGMGTCIADYDNDGFPDIYISGYQTGVLLHNVGGNAGNRRHCDAQGENVRRRTLGQS